MTIVQKLKKLFREIHGVEIKPDTITWKDIGLRVGTTGQAAKAIWKRYRNKNKVKSTVKPKFKSQAKILLFDLETAPNLAWCFGTFKQNVAYSQVEQNWFILTWSAKWLFEDEVMSDKLTPNEVLEQNDSRIIKSLWELINECDVLIAHNLLGFDNKRLHTRLLLNGLPLPKPYTVVDTLIHARKHLAFTSNRLDALGQILGVGKKIDTGGFDLWKRCMQGDEKALQEMELYNVQDVLLLQNVYLELLRYIKPHPNIGLLQPNNGKLCCASCGSENLVENGEYHTTVSVFQAYKCDDCGSLSRARKQLLAPKAKEHLTVSLPK